MVTLHAGAAQGSSPPRIIARPSTDRTVGTFRDPWGESLAVGCVLFHEGRLVELLRDCGPEHFSGDRARIVRVLRRRLEAGEAVDFLAVLPELRAAGVALASINAVAAWLDAPADLGELRQRLRDRRARRVIHAAGEHLVVIARDEARHVADVIAEAGIVADALRRVMP